MTFSANSQSVLLHFEASNPTCNPDSAAPKNLWRNKRLRQFPPKSPKLSAERRRVQPTGATIGSCPTQVGGNNVRRHVKAINSRRHNGVTFRPRPFCSKELFFVSFPGKKGDFCCTGWGMFDGHLLYWINTNKRRFFRQNLEKNWWNFSSSEW